MGSILLYKKTVSSSISIRERHFALILFLLIIGGFFTTISAQINITQAQLEAIFIPGGTHQYTNSEGTVNSVNIGKTGGPNTYDFSGVNLPAYGISNNYYVSNVPKLISRYPSNAVAIGESTDLIENNPVFLFGQDTVFILGIATDTSPQEYKHYSPYQAIGSFPITYGSTFSQNLSVYDTVFTSSGAVDSTEFYNVDNVTTVDGYGTLKIAGYEVQCLRIKLDHTNQGDKEFIYLTREGIFIDIITSSSEADTGSVKIYNMMVLLASSLTGTSDNNNNIPLQYELSQNYPNPFNPSTTIDYQIPKEGMVTLKVFDISGREIASLVNQYKPAGKYSITFNTKGLSSGVYFYRLRSNNFSSMKKMVLVK